MEKAVTPKLTNSSPLPAKDLLVPVVVVKTQGASDQKNVQWRNDKSYKDDTGEHLKRTTNEATQMFVELREPSHPQPGGGVRCEIL